MAYFPGTIGINLVDGNEHKIQVAWRAGFDPAAVTDHGSTVDWATAPPSVWFNSGTIFKPIVDPTTSAVITYAAMVHFIEAGSVLTVVWNAVDERLDILKVEHGSAVTT